MATCYDIFPEQNLIFIRLIGEHTLEESMALDEQIARDPRFIPYTMNVLADFAHGVMMWDAQALLRGIQRVQQVRPCNRIAHLSPTSVATLMVCREASYLARGLGINMAAFDCPLAAMRWLWTDEPLPSIDKRCVLHNHQARLKALP